MHDIKINCKRVYDAGIRFNEEAERIKAIRDKLKDVSSKLNEAWTGDDSHNFMESFDAHIYDLEDLINYLTDNEKLFKNIALCHNQVNADFVKQSERSGNDEYRV